MFNIFEEIDIFKIAFQTQFTIIVSVQTSTAIIVHAVMTQIVETDAIVTVTETTIGGMEFEPEMKVDKKDLLSLIKDQLLQTMLEIKDFPVPLIKDQVLMLLFLLKNGEIKTNKKCQIEMEINTFYDIVISSHKMSHMTSLQSQKKIYEMAFQQFRPLCPRHSV